MALSAELVHRFQHIYAEQFGEYIGYEEAEYELANLADVVRIILSSKERNCNDTHR